MIDPNKLKHLGTVKNYNEDDHIFYEGEPGNEMYLILKGNVEVYIYSFDANPIKLGELGPGDFFGEMSLLDDQPRSATVAAVSDVVLLSITKSNFESFIKLHPSMGHKIMKALCNRIRSLNAELSRYREGSKDYRPVRKKKSQSIDVPGTDAQTASIDITTPKTGGLFPDGHKAYSMLAPEEFNSYIYDKEVKCPVCEKHITVKMQRLSKLKLERTDPDMRQRYTDFEPVWYTIWLCPHCNYSNFYYEFEALPSKLIKILRSKADEMQRMIPTRFSGAHEINKVFTSYYMAIRCAELCSAAPVKLGKLWIQVSWLYKDIGDQAMYLMASSKALEYYHAAYYNSNLNISSDQEQQLCIILGELFLLKGDTKEALKHFHSATKKGRGKPLLCQQAQDRIQELKKTNHT